MSWSCVFDSLSINICQSASAASVNVTARCSSTRLTLKTTSTANDRSHRWLRCTLCNSLTIKGYDRCKFLSQDPNQPAWERAGRTPQVKVICILLQIKSYSMWKKSEKKKKKKRELLADTCFGFYANVFCHWAQQNLTKPRLRLQPCLYCYQNKALSLFPPCVCGENRRFAVCIKVQQKFKYTAPVDQAPIMAESHVTRQPIGEQPRGESCHQTFMPSWLIYDTFHLPETASCCQ